MNKAAMNEIDQDDWLENISNDLKLLELCKNNINVIITAGSRTNNYNNNITLNVVFISTIAIAYACRNVVDFRCSVGYAYQSH